MALLLAASLSQETDLGRLVTRYRLEWTSDPATGRETLRAKDLEVVLVPGIAAVLWNGRMLPVGEPIRLVEGRLVLPAGLAERIGRAVAIRTRSDHGRKPVRKAKWFTAVIDPGHGGIHSGGRGRSGLTEKEINLDVSLRLRRLLEGGGGRVLLTRDDDRHFSTDVYADLQHRVDFVNRARPDVFVSVHTNYVPQSGPRGFEVWVRKNDRACRDLAGHIRRELRARFAVPDRGTKDQRALYVLRKTHCPAALVELGFISNPSEESALRDPAQRQRYALALAEAVQKYLASGK